MRYPVTSVRAIDQLALEVPALVIAFIVIFVLIDVTLLITALTRFQRFRMYLDSG